MYPVKRPDEDSLGCLLPTLQAAETPLAERQRCFQRIVRRFQDMAFATAYAALGDAHAAEDAAQEAFVLAWERIGQVRNPAAFPGWFRRVVLGQCERIRRTRRHAVPLEHIAAVSPDPTQAAERNALRACLSEAVATLPEGERVAFLLHYGAEQTAREIAAFLETTPGAVRQRLHQARLRLRERIPLTMVQDIFQGQAPSHDSGFADRVVARLRPFHIKDWEAVSQIAHATRPEDSDGVESWLRYRQEFDESARFRRHFSAVRAGTEEVIGYGGLEQQGDDPHYLRLFVCCTNPSSEANNIQETLFQRLVEEAKAAGVTKLWSREYADDTPLITFLQDRGFQETAISVDIRLSVPDTSPVASTAPSEIAFMTVADLKTASSEAWGSFLLPFVNTFRAGVGLPEITPEGLMRWFENPHLLLSLSYAAYIPSEPDRCIGLGVLSRSRELPDAGIFEFFAVDPQFRETGVPEAMLARHHAGAAASGLKTLQMIVPSFQADLTPVFLYAGYARHFTYMRMEKSLTS